MPLEPTLLAAFGAMLFWGIGDFMIQRSTRRIGNLESLAFISLIGTLGLLPFVLPELPSLFAPSNLALLLFVSGVAFAVSLVNFEALRQGKLSVVEVLLQIELPITALFGFLFFREALSIAQLALISAVFAGGALIAADSFSFRLQLEKGAALALLAAAGMAVLNFAVAAGSRQVSPLMAIWVPWLLMGVICLLWLWKNGRLGSLEGFRHKRLVVGMGVIDTLAWLLYATAVAKSGLAITTAITESYPAVALFLGVFINKERILRHQWLGAALALTACVLLA